MTKRNLKVAIYTRKSTEHGLEQEFNSLAAQRESAEAYIKSQRSEGWVLVKQSYDDGGISGGTMERPALKRLLSEVEAGRVDIIVVYKVDRLTRSLSDFARIIERLDASDASFVSVTQQFNTSTSMGRLTLNVLLSFAQFEREVTAERIRDKVDASKKKGMWMGGSVPLGYDNVDKKLVINDHEAETVQTIFSAYLKHSNVQKLCHDINQRGYLTKKRNGGKSGDLPFRRGHLYYILNNPIYVGEISHKGICYQGNHEAIITNDLWQKVQAKLQDNRLTRPAKSNFGYPSLLSGILQDHKGRHFTPCHTSKKNKRYRYYNSNPTDDNQAILRYPAEQIENAVKNALINWLKDDTQHLDTDDGYSHRQQRHEIIEEIKSGTPHQQKEILHHMLQQVILTEQGLCLLIKSDGTGMGEQQKEIYEEDIIKLELKVRFKHGVIGRKIIIPNERQQLQKRDEKLIKLIAKAHLWSRDLHSGRYTTMTELANQHDINKADLGKNIRLAYLAPDIIDAIMEGRQPTSLKASHLRRLSNLPADWDEQRELLGFI